MVTVEMMVWWWWQDGEQKEEDVEEEVIGAGKFSKYKPTNKTNLLHKHQIDKKHKSKEDSTD